MVALGCTSIWTSPVIPKLRSDNSEVNPLGQPATTFQISMIAGLPALGCILGPIFLEKPLNIWGRRKTLMVLSILCIIILVFTAYARHLYTYYVLRVLLGVVIGCFVGAVPIFIAEISENHNRAKYGCLMGFFVPIGNLYGYLIGSIFSVKIFTILCGMPLAINFILMLLLVPESPVFLASKNKKDKALKVMCKLRNNSADDNTKAYQEMELMLKQSEKGDSNIWSFFKTKRFRRGFIITLGLNTLQFFSGMTPIMAFLGPTFDAANVGISGDYIAIFVAMVKIVSLFVASLYVEKLGRRPLLLISSLGSALTLFAIGLYFQLESTNSNISYRMSWLPVVCIVLFIVAYSVGIGPIPMAVMSEMFPNEARSISVSIIVFFTSVSIFVITFCFPIFVEAFGNAFCFWIFSGSCFVGVFFVYYMVPETKGKSFAEIQQMLEQ